MENNYNKFMNVSIILPTFNEKKNILLLVNSIKKNLKKIEYEIIIIDDNSPDKTAYVCKKEFKNNKTIKVIQNTKRLGLSESIHRGILNSSKKMIIVMDADFTHDPILIPKMLRLSNEYDIIIGSRYCAGGLMEDQIHSQLSFFYNLLLKLILKTQVQDNLGGYFCISKKNLNRLPAKKIFFGYGEYFFRLLFFSLKKKILYLKYQRYIKKEKEESLNQNLFTCFINIL